MITGYNTDVRYSDLVLHVQTEDKGQSNPFIESLIYHRGQVVAARRASYADLLKEGKGDEEIMAFMDHQHRLMIKAIQAGKFDHKIQDFLPEKSNAGTNEVATGTGEINLADEGGRTLDQVILEYLTSEAEQEQLVLMLEGETDFQAESKAELSLRARSSKTGEPIAGAKVNIKMISTFGGPRTLGVGETDDEGLLELPLEIPAVERGTAALIITAASQIGQAELKHLL